LLLFLLSVLWNRMFVTSEIEKKVVSVFVGLDFSFA